MATWSRAHVGSISQVDGVLNDTVTLTNATAPADFDPTAVNSVRIHSQGGIVDLVTWFNWSNDIVTILGDFKLWDGTNVAASVSVGTTTVDVASGGVPVDQTDNSPNLTLSVAQWEAMGLGGDANNDWNTYTKNKGGDGVTVQSNFVNVVIDYTPLAAAVEADPFTLAGVGSLAATAATIQHTGAATLAGQGTLTAAPDAIRIDGAAALAGAGTVTADGDIVTPAALPFTDDFTGTNGDPWDSTKWPTIASEGPTFDTQEIQSNEGYTKQGTVLDDFASYVAHAITNLQDSSGQIRVIPKAGTHNQWLYICFRSTGDTPAASAGRPTDCYYLRIKLGSNAEETEDFFYRRVAGQDSSGDGRTFGAPSGWSGGAAIDRNVAEPFFVKWEVYDNGSGEPVFNLKMWDEQSTEPVGWATRTDTDAASLSGVSGVFQLVYRNYENGQAVEGAVDDITYDAYGTAGVTTGEASLAGVGTLAAAAEVEVNAAAALAGAGTLAATAEVEHSGDATLAGTGTVVGAGEIEVSGAATVTGSGSLAAAGEVRVAGAAALAGVGTVAADGDVLLSGAAALAGAGTVAADGDVPGPSAFPWLGERGTRARNTSTSLAVPYPTDLAAGDLIVFFATHDGNSASRAWGNPSGWDVRANLGDGISDCYIGLWTKTAVGTESGSVTISHPLTSDNIGYMVCVKNPDETTPVGFTGSDRVWAVTSAVDVLGGTTVEDNSLLLAFLALDRGNVAAPTITDWTTEYNDSQPTSDINGAGAMMLSSEFATAGATGNLTVPLSPSAATVSVMLGISPGAAAPTYEGEATLAGTGSLAAAAEVEVNAAAALAGAGAVSAVGTATHTGVAAVAGTGAVATAGAVVVDSDASLAGVGALAAAAEVEVNAAAALAGAGTLQAAAQVLVAGAATAAGAGTVAADGAVVLAGAAAAAGVGALAATGELDPFDGAATLAGVGTVDADAEGTVGGAAVLSGAGTLAATGELAPIAGAATLQGAGAVLSAAEIVVGGSTAQAGSGAVAATGQAVVTGVAALAGAGTLTAAPQGQIDGAADLAGTGTLAAAAVLYLQGTATLEGTGTLDAAPEGAIYGAAALAGAGHTAQRRTEFSPVGAAAESVITTQEATYPTADFTVRARARFDVPLPQLAVEQYILGNTASWGTHGWLLRYLYSGGNLYLSFAVMDSNAGFHQPFSVLWEPEYGKVFDVEVEVIQGGVWTMRVDGQVIGTRPANPAEVLVQAPTTGDWYRVGSDSTNSDRAPAPFEMLELQTLDGNGATLRHWMANDTPDVLNDNDTYEAQGQTWRAWCTGSTIVTTAHAPEAELVLGGNATLDGVGTATATGELNPFDGAASMAGAGTVASGATVTHSAFFDGSGVGSTDAAGQAVFGGTSDLGGTGTVVATPGAIVWHSPADLAGAGELQAVGSRAFTGLASLAGVGTATVSSATFYWRTDQTGYSDGSAGFTTDSPAYDPYLREGA